MAGMRWMLQEKTGMQLLCNASTSWCESIVRTARDEDLANSLQKLQESATDLSNSWQNLQQPSAISSSVSVKLTNPVVASGKY